MKVINNIKLGQASGSLKLNVELQEGCGEIGIDVMMKLCQSLFQGAEIPGPWNSSILMPIHQGNGDGRNFGDY